MKSAKLSSSKSKPAANGLITKARQLLASPYFFRKYLQVLRLAGLIGEDRNAVVLLIVVVSRLLRRPLNAFVRGRSSSGKNWLVSRVLLLLPQGRFREISSASERAWNYSKNHFEHRVIYLQEMSQAGGAVHPLRLLISEGKLIYHVTAWKDGERVNKKYVARGPVASISTTTQPGVQIDDETRNLSVLTDESPEQTRRIVQSYARTGPGLPVEERRLWQQVHREIEQAANVEITFPAWFDQVADTAFVEDVAVRRYFPAFVEACRAVCLLRSFQSDHSQPKDGQLALDFADFAVTALIFDKVFVQSLHRHEGSTLEVREAVRRISARKNQVAAKDVAEHMGISMDSAYERLREAVKAGVVTRSNAPEEDNRKFFIAAPQPRFIPRPEKLFEQINEGPETVRFVHPFTGKWVSYSRSRKKK
jgi:hypothetical protein